jgi:hypothetical protein
MGVCVKVVVLYIYIYIYRLSKISLSPEFWRQIPVARGGMELHDHLLLFLGDVAPLEIRHQVVDPPQPAALPAPQQARWIDSSSEPTRKGNLNFARRIL